MIKIRFIYLIIGVVAFLLLQSCYKQSYKMAPIKVVQEDISYKLYFDSYSSVSKKYTGNIEIKSQSKKTLTKLPSQIVLKYNNEVVIFGLDTIVTIIISLEPNEVVNYPIYAKELPYNLYVNKLRLTILSEPPLP